MFDITSKLFDRLIETNNGCLEFIGARSDGYGTIRIKGRVYKAHRLAWEHYNGSIPENNIICHTCDNPPCCNIAHLFIGTKQDNSDDMIAKERDNHNGQFIKGSLNGISKLVEKDVLEIKQLLRDGYTQQSIADFYNVSRENIKKINLRQSWSWLS